MYRITYVCVTSSCASTKSSHYVPYKDNRASKLRYELKRNHSTDTITIRSNSRSSSKYSVRSYEPIPHSRIEIDIRNGAHSRPASPNINFVRLNYRPRSIGSANRSYKIDKENACSRKCNAETVQHTSNISLASDDTIAKETASQNSIKGKLNIGRQSRPLTRTEFHPRPISIPEPVGVWKATTTPMRGTAVPNAEPSIEEWNLLHKSSRLSSLKHRSVSSNRTPRRRITRGSSQHNFKPQLEDIQSSFLILNKE
ncbi:uncharacterized protein LOC121732734 [Aricia agestis]|uniref:uncharacterized protein LOC121732734 n=1 Tax=Aricia agestis TaxID=91739 RepID=UPI001C2095CE|nr:uncharacterized protein LOC121732734 [Aricia agestis]